MTIMGALDSVVVVCQGICMNAIDFSSFSLSLHLKKKDNAQTCFHMDPFRFQTPFPHETRSMNDVHITPDLLWDSRELDNISSASMSPVTLRDHSLWSPDNFSSGGPYAPGSLFSPNPDGAYTPGHAQIEKKIEYKCQLLERNLQKEREEHNTLKCISTSSHANANANNIFREKLIDMQNLLIHMFSTSRVKRGFGEESSLPPPSPITNMAKATAKFRPYSREQYPLVKFWKQDDWKHRPGAKKKQDTSELGELGSTQADQPDATKPSMPYVEDENGNVIDNGMVGDIRESARLIWRGMRHQGKAPERWSQVTKAEWEEFNSLMEE